MRKTKKFAALLLAMSMVTASLAGCGSSDSTKDTAKETAEDAAETKEETTEEAEEETAKDTESEDTDKVIRIGFDYDASSLDPGMGSDDATLLPIRLCNEPLLRMVNGEAEPGIAESYEASEDATEWTFHLRESKWADGTDLTAEDFCYSILRMIDPESVLDKANTCYFIEGAEEFANGEGSEEDVAVEAVDEHTLKIKAVRPVQEIEFTSVGFMPVKKDAVEAAGENYGAEADNVVTNGPFTVTDWTHDSEIVMTKNENYWNADAINLDEIHMLAGSSGDTAVDMMLTGSLDVCSFRKQVYIDTVTEDENYDELICYSGSQALHLNHHGKTEETGKWLGNVNFRKALSAAIDREALVASVYTTDVPASGLISSTEKGVDGYFTEEYEIEQWSTAQDADAAKEYLEKAMEELGASDVSEIPTFTMLAMDSEGNITCLNAVADMWLNVLGIKCELDMEPITEMVSKAYAGDYDFWKGGNSPDIDMLETMADYSASEGIAGMQYEEDDEFEALYQEAVNAVTWKERKDGIAELASHWTENMMDLIVTWQAEYYVYDKDITGIAINGYNVDFTYADIAE